MMVKTILVPVSDGEASAAALNVAFALGRQFAAHVDAIHVRADPRAAVPFVGEGMSSAMVEDMMQLAEKEANERAKRARALFDEQRAKEDVPVVEAGPGPGGVTTAWREEVGREDEVLSEVGRLADLIVVGHPGRTVELPSAMTLHAALMDTGRPVLMVPQGVKLPLGRTVAVAWNASPESARAVRAALPFLTAAHRVVILAAEEGGPLVPSAGELAASLAWHGVQAEVLAVRQGHAPIATLLLDECGRIGADLVVMGAYGHSRLREMILGGVTRHMLESADILLLMSH